MCVFLRNSVYLTASLFAVAFIAAQPAFGQPNDTPNNVSVETVYKAWRARQDRVKTLRFEWVGKDTYAKGAYTILDGPILPADTTTFNTSFKLIISGDRVRAVENRVWNFVQSKKLGLQQRIWVKGPKGNKRLFGERPQRYPRAFIFKEELDESDVDDPVYFPLYANYRPFSDFTTRFSNFMKRYKAVPGRHVVEGRPCVLLQTSQDELAVTDSVWVDPGRDFIPLRFAFSHEGRILSQLTFLRHKIDGKEWTPLEWESLELDRNGGIRTSFLRSVKKYSLNERIDSSEFELKFPEGSWVDDKATSSEYIIRKGGEKRLITKDEEKASYEALLNTDSGKASSYQSDRVPWLRYLAPLVLGALVLIALAILLRRFRITHRRMFE